MYNVFHSNTQICIVSIDSSSELLCKILTQHSECLEELGEEKNKKKKAILPLQEITDLNSICRCFLNTYYVQAICQETYLKKNTLLREKLGYTKISYLVILPALQQNFNISQRESSFNYLDLCLI